MNAPRSRSLADYLSACRRRKLALVIPALILAFATATTLREMPNLYESSARMLLKPDGAQDSVRIDELRRQVSTREALEAIAKKCELKHETMEAGIAQMRVRVAIEPDRQPGSFTVSFRATEAETARAVTSELANTLLAGALEESSQSREADVLRKRASDISIQLRELEQKDPWLLSARDSTLAAPQPARNSRPSLEAQRAQQMTLESLKDQQYKFQQQLADVERRVTAQRQIVEQQKRGSSLRDNPTYSALIIRRTELQGQRDTLLNRQELTDKHPRVSAITDQIAAINRQIEELRQQDAALVNQSPEARELASLESDRNRLKIDLEVAGRELARRSAGSSAQPATVDYAPAHREAGSPKLVQEYLGLKRNYKEVAAELQDLEARHKSNAGVGSKLRLVEPATLPERPVSRNSLLLIAIAATVGLALGVAFALLAETRRFNSLQNAADVEYYTRLPLLAAIPRSTTAGERKRARWQATARFALATAFSVAATAALTKLFIALDIFTRVI